MEKAKKGQQRKGIRVSIRWEELCMYCQLYAYCSDTLGATCEYPKRNWRAMRAELVVDLASLDEEGSDEKDS